MAVPFVFTVSNVFFATICVEQRGEKRSHVKGGGSLGIRGIAPGESASVVVTTSRALCLSCWVTSVHCVILQGIVPGGG